MTTMRAFLVGVMAVSALAPAAVTTAAASTAPAVTGVAPSSGPDTGQNSVTITGTALASATAVNFGTSAATVTSNTDTQIVATAPPVAAGQTVDVTVTTAGGTSAITSADHYSYTRPPWEDFGGVLTSGPVAGSKGSPTVDSFAVGADGAVWHRWLDANRAWRWESLGGHPSSLVAPLFLGCEIDLFVRGADLALWQ